MNEPAAARTYHDLTRHGSPVDRSRLVDFQPLDPANQPAPFKEYRDRETRPLPRDTPVSDPPAGAVLSGEPGPPPGRLDAGLLASLLHYAAGVVRTTQSLGQPKHFRAAMSAGNLHPVEVYLVCGDLDGIPAGLHHFAPRRFGLTGLRPGDLRPALAAAAADEAVAGAPVTLILTGIPWRTAWKYGERGYRHLYWDAGTLIGNLLTVASAHGVEARVLVGFVDREVCHLVGVDGVGELPLAVIPLRLRGHELHRTSQGDPEGEGAGASGVGGTGGDRGDEESGAGGRPAGGASGTGAGRGGPTPTDLPPLGADVAPLAPAPITFPLITDTHRASSLPDAGAVEDWRQATPGVGTPAADRIPPPGGLPGRPVEEVILDRGSTRMMRWETAPHDLVRWGVAVATRPVPGDLAAEGATLLDPYLAVHDVAGMRPGPYRWEEEPRPRDPGLPGPDGGPAGPLEAGQLREVTAELCLRQPLGGDAAVTAFFCAELEALLEARGARGYRAAQLAAGVAAERLALAAFALGLGATGLTFFDEPVSAFFATSAECMLVTAAGVPAYRNRPGGRPGQPAELARFDRLMAELSRQLTGR